MDKNTFQRLLSLVNSALWDKQINEVLFTGMDDVEWNNLYRFATLHGVLATAYDGVLYLPSLLQPPLKLRIAWDLSTKQIENKYEQIRDAAISLSGLFKKEQINMLVFKGLNLASYYPVPSHREFGDIDIYLFGKHREGDILLDKIANKKIGNLGYKHSNYYYKDVMIENHAYLLNVRDSDKIEKLNRTLLGILQENKTEQNIQKDKLLFPSSDFTALFFIIHAIKHLSGSPLQLRTYCDWALFLKAHANELDITKWERILSDTGLLDIAEVLTYLAFQWMEVPANFQFQTGKHIELEERLYKEILQPFYPACQSKAFSKVFIYKCKRFHARNKRYISFYGGSLCKHYSSSVLSSFVDHVRHPETIFKFQ